MAPQVRRPTECPALTELRAKEACCPATATGSARWGAQPPGSRCPGVRVGSPSLVKPAGTRGDATPLTLAQLGCVPAGAKTTKKVGKESESCDRKKRGHPVKSKAKANRDRSRETKPRKPRKVGPYHLSNQRSKQVVSKHGSSWGRGGATPLAGRGQGRRGAKAQGTQSNSDPGHCQPPAGPILQTIHPVSKASPGQTRVKLGPRGRYSPYWPKSQPPHSRSQMTPAKQQL